MFSVSFHVKKEFFQKICPRLLFGFKLRHCSCILRYRVLKEIICNYCFIVLHILLNIVITWKSQNLESNKVIIIIIIIIIIIVSSIDFFSKPTKSTVSPQNQEKKRFPSDTRGVYLKAIRNR